MNKNNLVVIIASVFVVIAIAVGGYFAFVKDNTFTVLFEDAKKLQPGADVYLSGVNIGEVKAVEPSNRKVAVKIKLDRKYRDQVTMTSNFFIDDDTDSSDRKCVLIRLSSAQGRPVVPGDILEGTNSSIYWKSLELQGRWQNFLSSEEVQSFANKVEKMKNDFQQEIDKIDWAQLEKDLRQDSIDLTEDFDKLFNSEEMQNATEEIKNKMDNLQTAIERLSDSREAKELQKSLENLAERFTQELSRIEKEE